MVLCAVCLRSKMYTRSVYQVRHENISPIRKMSLISGIPIIMSPGFPRSICRACETLVNIAYNLRTRIRNSNKKLKKMYIEDDTDNLKISLDPLKSSIEDEIIIVADSEEKCDINKKDAPIGNISNDLGKQEKIRSDIVEKLDLKRDKHREKQTNSQCNKNFIYERIKIGNNIEIDLNSGLLFFKNEQNNQQFLVIKQESDYEEAQTQKYSNYFGKKKSNLIQAYDIKRKRENSIFYTRVKKQSAVSNIENVEIKQEKDNQDLMVIKEEPPDTEKNGYIEKSILNFLKIADDDIKQEEETVELKENGTYLRFKTEFDVECGMSNLEIRKRVTVLKPSEHKPKIKTY